MRTALLAVALFALLAGCRTMNTPDRTAPLAVDGRWAVVIHGGAGTIGKDATPERVAEYKAALDAALRVGRERAARGDHAMDVAEAVVRILEDDWHFNAGKGAAFNERAEHELDASIMDGSTLKCGAVAGVRTIKNPISLARLVMEKTRHILLMGDGAEKFADTQPVERVPNTYFDTDHRRKSLEEKLKQLRQQGSMIEGAPLGGPLALKDKSDRYSTVGCVVLDTSGRLAAATSTGGLTAKKWGRVGDSPIIGAGNYANAWCAVSGTGTGEEFIRHGVCRSIAARMQFGGQSLAEACDALVFRTLEPDDGGVIAVDSMGNIAMPYSTEGMYRGCATSAGRYEVHIFEP